MTGSGIQFCAALREVWSTLRLHGRALAERAAGSVRPDYQHYRPHLLTPRTPLGAPAADRHRRRGLRGGRQLRHRVDAARLRADRDRHRDAVAHLGDRGTARRPSSRRGRRHGAGARRGRPFGAAPARHRGARRARHGHRQRPEGRGRRERRQPADRPRAGRPAQPDRRRDVAAHRCRRPDQSPHRRAARPPRRARRPSRARLPRWPRTATSRDAAIAARSRSRPIRSPPCSPGSIASTRSVSTAARSPRSD